jgi:hypothetical protein
MKNFSASLTASIAAIPALYFCVLVSDDVVRNRKIGNPGLHLNILAIGTAAVVFSLAWVWMRPTRRSFYWSLAASLLLFCFSMICGCI